MALDITTVRTPGWWLARLVTRLVTEQRPHVERHDRYLRGDHPIPELNSKDDREAFSGFLKTSRSNYVSLVVEALIERMRVVGWRGDGDDKTADDESMAEWRKARLDADQSLVHRAMAGLSLAFVMVGAHPRRKGDALVTIEDPRYVITESFRDDRREIEAAVKLWVDDEGYIRATLFKQDFIYRFRSPNALKMIDSTRGTYETPTGLTITAGLDEYAGSQLNSFKDWVEAEEPERNALGVVPIVPFANRDSVQSAPMAEFEDVIDIQNRLNTRLLHQLVAERFASWRQKVVLNYAVEEREVLDEHGDPTGDMELIPPDLSASPGEVWFLDGEKVGVWESAQTDTTQLLKGVESDIRDMAAITRTPPHYLLSGIVNVDGGALKAAETGLVAKVRERLAHAGESWESVMRLIHLVKGRPERADLDSTLEVVWADPESRSLADLSDAAVKQQAAGVPWRQRMELLGYTPAQIDGMEADRAQDAILASLATPPQQLGAVPSKTTNQPADVTAEVVE